MLFKNRLVSISWLSFTVLVGLTSSCCSTIECDPPDVWVSIQVKDIRGRALDSSTVSSFKLEEYYESTNEFRDAHWNFGTCDSLLLVNAQMTRHIDGFRIKWNRKSRLYKTSIIQTRGGCCEAFEISEIKINGRELVVMENHCNAYEITI